MGFVFCCIFRKKLLSQEAIPVVVQGCRTFRFSAFSRPEVSLERKSLASSESETNQTITSIEAD
jgi:hypothetical protein